MNVIDQDEDSLQVTWEPLVGVDGYEVNIDAVEESEADLKVWWTEFLSYIGPTQFK